MTHVSNSDMSMDLRLSNHDQNVRIDHKILHSCTSFDEQNGVRAGGVKRWKGKTNYIFICTDISF